MPCVELSLCTDGIRCTLPFCAQAWLRRRVASMVAAHQVALLSHPLF